MNQAEQFFYEHAGYSWDPKKETMEDGRRKSAKDLADAEYRAYSEGYTFDWEVDPTINSSDFDDVSPPYALWVCTLRDPGGDAVESLSGIDFGPDGLPGCTYGREVCAGLAYEHFINL